MNQRLQQLFDRLEAQRHEVLKSVEQLSDEAFSRKPSEGKWSVSELLAHLQTSEQLSVQYLNKKILGIQQYKDTTLYHEVLMLLVKASQRLPLKFRAPKVVVANTPSFATREQLIIQWNKTRAELKSLLEKFSDHHISKQVYRHPRAGMINIQHALIFFREHVIHHRPQINRLLK